ncbi:NELL2-interacting cell ontogeny regulator 1 isoform 1-T1 [Glossophaga mutica]
MASPSLCRPPRPWLLLLLLLLNATLLGTPARAEPTTGSSIPAQSRPCVDCHAFEFMQRALQDLRKTAYSLDTRFIDFGGERERSICHSAHGRTHWLVPTEALLLQAERRALCACWPAGR